MTRRARLALLALAMIGVAAACSDRTPTVEGSGWPNVVLSERSADTSELAVTVRPVAVGADGAVFEVQAERRTGPESDGEQAADASEDRGELRAPSLTTLEVNEESWGFERWVPEESSATSLSGRLEFSKGGPARGGMRLSIVVDDLPYVFDWRLP